MALIKLCDLSKTYDLGEVKVAALKGVSLEIQEGELDMAHSQRCKLLQLPHNVIRAAPDYVEVRTVAQGSSARSGVWVPR